jgi:inorganic pyrophosphatase
MAGVETEVLVHIEIAKNSTVKYEFDKELNALVCDRVLHCPFAFPFNYGYIPNTLSGDGDPLDAVVVMDEDLVPGSYIKCRVIGCLETEDEKGEDAKLILVPINRVSPVQKEIESVNDLPAMFLEKVKYFYQHYKDLEGKQVIVGNLLDKEEAFKIYLKSKLI